MECINCSEEEYAKRNRMISRIEGSMNTLELPYHEIATSELQKILDYIEAHK